MVEIIKQFENYPIYSVPHVCVKVFGIDNKGNRYEGEAINLKDILTAFEKSVKEEFLKRILPEKEHIKEQDMSWNNCIDDIINNANKEGVNI